MRPLPGPSFPAAESFRTIFEKLSPSAPSRASRPPLRSYLPPLGSGVRDLLRSRMHFTLIWIFKLTATLCAGLFTGAAIYITLVEHPARMKCGTDLAAMEFAAGYRRASVLQAFLAFTGFVSAMAAGGLSYTKGWYWGAAFLGSVIPYTL